MKRLILAAVSAFALVTAAQAADLPSSKAPPPAPLAAIPAFSWTGFYVGANAGYNWGGDGGNWYNYCGSAACVWADAEPAPVWWAGVPNGDIGSQDGWEFGVQAGYNYQMGSFVIGIEGDINWLGGDKQRSWAWSGNAGDEPADQEHTDYRVIAYGKGEMNWLGTLRARLGFAADHFLIYGTGGLAFGNVSSSAGLTGQCWGDRTTPFNNACDNIGIDPANQPEAPGAYYNFATVAGSKSGTRVGWTLGLGAEYAITNNWTVKAEWLYYDLGSNNFSTTGTTVITNGQTGTAWYTPNIRRDVTGNLARLGVNYKF